MAVDDELDFRRQIGVALRFIIVLVPAVVWVAELWWWLAAIGVAFNLAMIALHPLGYLVLYPLVYIQLAITDSREPVLPTYWDDYPDKYLDWCWRSIKLGFPTLWRWVINGF